MSGLCSTCVGKADCSWEAQSDQQIRKSSPLAACWLLTGPDGSTACPHLLGDVGGVYDGNILTRSFSLTNLDAKTARGGIEFGVIALWVLKAFHRRLLNI